MTRTTVLIGSALGSLIIAIVVVARFGVDPRLALGFAIGVWLVCAAIGRGLHGAYVARRLLRESGRGPTTRAMDVARRALSAAAGRAGFTREIGSLAALECAVIALRRSSLADPREDAIVSDLVRARPTALQALVSGLRDIQDCAVDGLASPRHALFFSAKGLLDLVGHPVSYPLGDLRARADWGRRRLLIEPTSAPLTIAARLLRARLPIAARAALRRAAHTSRRERLARLARCAALLRRVEDGSLLALPAAELVEVAPELSTLR